MTAPATAAEAVGQIILGLYPDIPIFGDTDLQDYLGVFPNFRIHSGISRVRLGSAGTKRPRRREELQIDFWQMAECEADQDQTVLPAIEQALDEFVPVNLGAQGNLIRLVADGLSRHDYNAQTHIAQDLITVVATFQPASAMQGA